MSSIAVRLVFWASLTSMSSLVAAPTLIQFNIDETRSFLTWDLRFSVGTSIVPFVDTTPGSRTSPVRGGFFGDFDPITNVVSVSTGLAHPIIQPDFRFLQPSSTLYGLASSVNGSFSVLGLASGIASARSVRYGVSYTINDFRPDEIPIGTSVVTSPFNLGTSIQGVVDYNFTGLLTTTGSIPIDLSESNGNVTATYTRLSKTTGEFSISNLDRLVSFNGLDFGGIFLPGEFRLQGNVVTRISFVPEAHSLVLIAIAIGIVGAFHGLLWANSQRRLPNDVVGE